MSVDLFPQAGPMADESMVRNLSAQAEAIWPLEQPLLSRYGVGADDPVRVLDAGCGTGEFALRLGMLWPRATVLGVDILDHHLDLARRRAAANLDGSGCPLGDRLRFEHRSIYQLDLPGGSFDLVACRHVLQSIPQPERVIAELARVTRPGGRLHLIVEDYGMVHFPRVAPGGPGAIDVPAFWLLSCTDFGAATSTDLFIGRHAVPLLERLGLKDVTIDYLPVDTTRAREPLRRIFTAWRDGYVDVIGDKTRFAREQVRAAYDAMLATLDDERAYAVWHVPVASARVP